MLSYKSPRRVTFKPYKPCRLTLCVLYQDPRASDLRLEVLECFRLNSKLY